MKTLTPGSGECQGCSLVNISGEMPKENQAGAKTPCWCLSNSREALLPSLQYFTPQTDQPAAAIFLNYTGLDRIHALCVRVE